MNDLEIRIKTILEGQGIKATDDQLKSLVRSSRDAQTATANTGRAAKDAGDAISQFGRRGSEAKDAFEGLTTVANGGEGAIFGMAKAWRALTAAFAANPVTAALALILGLLPLIKKGFDLIGEAAEKSAMRMAGTGEQSKAVAKNLAELKESSEKNIRAATADAESLASAYRNVSAEIDGALARFKQVESARAGAEASALELKKTAEMAAAKTPEEREAIAAKYDGQIAGVKAGADRSIANQEEGAAFKKRFAASALADDAQKALDASDAKVAAAQKKENDARRSGDPLAYGNALRAREAAEKERDAVQAKFGPQLKQAKTDIADSDAAIKAAEFRNQELKNTTLKGDITRKVEDPSVRFDPSRRAELRRTAEEAQASGDFEAQGRAVAELRKMDKAASKLTKAVTEASATTTQAFEQTAKVLEKNKQRTKNTAESRAGN